MRNFTWNRFPIKNLLIDSLLTPIVESTYLNRDMCKFELSQKDESRWQSTDSSKACRNTSAFKCLCNVLYVPKLKCNLFSVRAAACEGNVVTFDKTSCKIHNPRRKLRGVGEIVGNLYRLNCNTYQNGVGLMAVESFDFNVWHQRPGHLDGGKVKETSRKKTFNYRI